MNEYILKDESTTIVFSILRIMLVSCQLMSGKYI